MINLPYDYSRCTASKDCEKKQQCARYTSPANPVGWQSMTDFSSLGSKCYFGFIDNKKNNEDVTCQITTEVL